MKTLVTGATSGLGRNAVEHLATLQKAVRATGRNLCVGNALRGIGVEFVAADLVRASHRDIDELLNGIDTVWHCAALSSPWGRLCDFHAANVVATERLAKAAMRQGVRRFVHVSTPSLYFDYRHRRGIHETFCPTRYVNHYARTKAQAEHVIRALASERSQTTFVVLRPRGIFGPHDRVLLPRVLRILRERRGRLPLPRGGAALLDLTYSGNVVRAMELATTGSHIPSGEAFNITNGEPEILRNVIEALLSSLQVSFQIVAMPYRVLDATARVAEACAALTGREPAFTRYGIGALHYDMTLDIQKARRVLGYRPVESLADGISETVRWIRTHGIHYGI